MISTESLTFSFTARASLAILSLGSVAVAGLTQQSACYNADGSLAQNNFPCFLDQENSSCCGPLTICEDSGLCRESGTTGVDGLIRGSCTDPTWGSQQCPHYCMGALVGGVNIVSCQNVTHSDLDFCCDGHPGCCDSGIGRFQVDFNTDIITIGTAGVSASTFEKTTTSSSPPGTTTTSSSSTATGSSSRMTGSPSALSTASSSSPSNTSDSNGPVEKISSGLSTGAKAGIGAACGVVGLAIITALVYFFLIRRREPASAKGSTASLGDVVEKHSHEPPREMDGRAAAIEVMAYEPYHFVELSANGR